MANIHRIRSNFKQGTLGADLVTTGTTINFGSDPGFDTLGTDEYLAIVIDPEGAAQGPEIVYLTAYTATQTTGTIERGKESTADPGVSHPSGTAWIHGPTARDNDWAPWALSLHEPSGVASLDIDISGYAAVRIVGWLLPATDNVSLYVRFSNDGGSTFESGAGYYAWAFGFALAGPSDGAIANASDTKIELHQSGGNGATEGSYFEITILTPATASAPTAISGTSGNHQFNGGVPSYHNFGKVLTAEVNNAIQFLFSSGNIADGHVMVYGFPAAA
jgi:hypothetical protein